VLGFTLVITKLEQVSVVCNSLLLLVPSSQNAFSGSSQPSIINVSFPSPVIDLLILQCLKLRTLREMRRHSNSPFNLV
jgi:hypothetical protein